MPVFPFKFDGDKLLDRINHGARSLFGGLFGKPLPLKSQLEEIRNAYKRKGGLDPRIIAERLGVAIGDELTRLRHLKPDDFNTLIDALTADLEKRFEDVVLFYDTAPIHACGVKRVVIVSDPIIEAQSKSSKARRDLDTILKHADEVCVISTDDEQLARMRTKLIGEGVCADRLRKLSLRRCSGPFVGVAVLIEPRSGISRVLVSDVPPRFVGDVEDNRLFKPQAGWLSEVSQDVVTTEIAKLKALVNKATEIGAEI